MRKKILILLIILLAYYGLFVKFHIAIPCPIYKFTHFYCPGCGITRMLFSLIQLDFYQSFRYNPLVFILLVIYLISKLVEVILKRKIILKPYVTYILLVIVIIYGIIRNIPGLEYLQPTIIK